MAARPFVDRSKALAGTCVASPSYSPAGQQQMLLFEKRNKNFLNVT
jgi:hypothetical protein